MSDFVRKILVTRLETVINSSYPIVYDNSPSYNGGEQAFIKCMLDQIDSEIISKKCQRELFNFVAQINTDEKVGDGLSARISKLIKDGFFTYIESGVKCMTVEDRRIGVIDGWYRRNVTITVKYNNNVTGV